jgi:hypothetical protein
MSDKGIPEPTGEDYAAVAAWAKEQPLEAPADDSGEGSDSESDPVGNEAAKYRRRLRETEAERDKLIARVEAMQRNEIQRLAADKLADPADVWRDGATVADILDDDGNIDHDKVSGLVGGLVETHPHWAASVKTPTPRNGLRSGASAASQPRPVSWAEAMGSPRAEVQ